MGGNDLMFTQKQSNVQMTAADVEALNKASQVADNMSKMEGDIAEAQERARLYKAAALCGGTKDIYDFNVYTCPDGTQIVTAKHFSNKEQTSGKQHQIVLTPDNVAIGQQISNFDSTKYPYIFRSNN